MTKHSVYCVPYLRNHTSCDHNFWHTCLKWCLQKFFFIFLNSNFLGCFHFFKILISCIASAVKGQKMTQNGKKLCLSGSISQELYIIWSSLMVHLCKMKVSPGLFFHFFKILIFQVARGVKGQKHWPKMTINSVCCTPYLRNYTS